MPRWFRSAGGPVRTVLLGLLTVAAAARGDAVNPPLPAIEPIIAELGLQTAPTPVRERPGWSRPTRVIVPKLDPELLAQLAAVAPGVELVSASDAAEAARQAADADAVIGFCTPELLALATRLHWVQLMSAGVESCLAIPALRERGVLLTNMQRVAGPVMAEHVLALMLAFSRSLQFYIPEQRAGRWTEQPTPPARSIALQGKTVLVVGLGGIGTEVAKRAHALGLRVIATRNSGREGPPYVAYVGLADELPKLVSQADFVVNTVPLTPQTRGMFDARLFSAMKPTAYFINVGRGGSVVQSDLVAALTAGTIAGAGLDVTEPEPLPPGDPLWRLPNVILTPHVAADTDLGRAVRWAVVRENLRRYVAGEPMLSVVDPGKGY